MAVLQLQFNCSIKLRLHTVFCFYSFCLSIIQGSFIFTKLRQYLVWKLSVVPSRVSMCIWKTGDRRFEKD